MVCREGEREDIRSACLIDVATVTLTGLSGAIRLHGTDDEGAEYEVEIRLGASQARQLGQDLQKLALEIEATLFDRP